ncbi:MAG: NUDIX hydrolase [Rhizomicrobium sp.]|jgi:8-oxo-dGTP pyrophosphatase MutT (NUDIX family)
MSDSKPIVQPVPAATILIVRDAEHGLEVFMVKRHHQIDFVAGALVFPGGKSARGDFDAALAEFADGISAWSTDDRALAATAIREAFEESGILLGRDADTKALVEPSRLESLQHYREPLEKGEISLLDMLRTERLRLACDELVHFAHWVTPKNMPKRFDTHFYLAKAPAGQLGRHDGRESVDSIWIRPQDAITDRKKWNVIFPTKLNLMKLGTADTVDEAMAAARATPPLTVEPWVEEGPEGGILRIREDAGYLQTTALLRDDM